MTNYEKLIKTIELKESWEDENEFLIDILFTSSLKLLNKCYEELETEGLIVVISPLLRQVQENIVVLLGLLTKSYSIEKYIEEKHRPKQIMKKVKASDENIDEEEFNMLNEFLLELKKLLHEYSHTSFDGAMSLFTERFQSFESRQFNKISILILIIHLEAPLIALFNEFYNKTFDLPNPQTAIKELKLIKTLKYATKNMPKSVKDFINQSEYLSKYYTDTFKNFMNEVNNIQKIKIE